jgi:hypothetical protein
MNTDAFKAFFMHPKTQECIRLMRSVNCKDFPSTNYFGVNFSENKLSNLKLYYTFFHTIDMSLAKQFLPSTEEFEKYYPFWEENSEITIQHSGCAFTLKANANLEFSKGFHLRFKLNEKTTPHFTLPKFIELSPVDLQNYQGISFEYSPSGIKKKNYYYISDEKTKLRLSEIGKNTSIQNATLIEYTESENDQKIILWDNEISGHPKKTKLNFPEKHLEFNALMKNTFNLQNYFDGAYLNRNETASYFYHIEKQNNFPFDSKLNRNINTIDYLVKNLNLL